MASSKEATGSEPEREKKKEVSEDSGGPFMFRWVSGIRLMTIKAVLFTVAEAAVQQTHVCYTLALGYVTLVHLMARTEFPGSDHVSSHALVLVVSHGQM